jgi:hypothetical protein
MEPSERVTWEICPNCQREAAVGWIDAQAVEFDCQGGGCWLSPEQLHALAPGAVAGRLIG